MRRPTDVERGRVTPKHAIPHGCMVECGDGLHIVEERHVIDGPARNAEKAYPNPESADRSISDRDATIVCRAPDADAADTLMQDDVDRRRWHYVGAHHNDELRTGGRIAWRRCGTSRTTGERATRTSSSTAVSHASSALRRPASW